MVKITKVSAWSVAKMFGALYAILGLIFGVIMFLVSLAAGTDDTSGIAAMLGVGILIALPVMYGVMGIVSGFVFSWLYNFLAKKIGGIVVDVEKIEASA